MQKIDFAVYLTVQYDKGFYLNNSFCCKLESKPLPRHFLRILTEKWTVCRLLMKVLLQLQWVQ